MSSTFPHDPAERIPATRFATAADPADDGPQFVRVAECERKAVEFVLDGRPARALAGDTVLTAILLVQRRVRTSEFSGLPRAGFCLIGACQDCWLRTEAGARIRACSTPLEPGMRIVTGAPAAQDGGAR
ncbi:(2Fe-2S)-binding protein [Trinickia terrae]|uniref:(2Fe-2S)-binding protein n=1 Tax=Trinickia terrae TaxID=2571161 RepID=A0A4U1IFE8_9BURK|nr:(2Fe-2S)-binding protein [Trinickia terrae]TKC92295.1 (2Fe-2S)-binding protein [Trinickia terrae]